MLYWIAGITVWLLSAIGIFFVMSDVFREKYPGLSKQAFGGYAFHGVTAVLALWLLIKAIAH